MLSPSIHRHIGGLEKQLRMGIFDRDIHRHIGGLEKIIRLANWHKHIHRHIGGWVLISKTVKFIYFY